MYRELELWEDLLVIETRRLEAWAVLKDNEIAAAGNREAHAHDTFLAGEEAWKSYRAAQCEFVGEEFAGGTAQSSIEAHCHMDLVVERLFRLHMFLGEISQMGEP
jgi:hypothetical protein